ncbi:MAG TPA: CotH kinase family protein, partial [Ruminiclostridium sp.]|nr:CotH kinase family protein [Ruminiclostridium sp.]
MTKGRFLILSSVIALVTGIFAVMSVAAAPLYGDLNSDGSIDSIDYSLMKGYVLGISSIPNPSSADLNGDGNIDAIDYSLMKQYILKTITEFPVSGNPGGDNPGDDSPEKKLMGDISFSVPSCTFRNQISVALSSNIANAQIRYTTDGSVPTVSSALFSSPLTLTKTTQLRAQAFVNGAPSGNMGTQIYIASSIDAKHDIPVLILDAYGGGKPARDYKDVAIMLMEPKNNEASLLQTPTMATRGGFHVRGQSSANFEKTPYRLELWDNKNGDAKYPIMGMPADGDWALLSPFPDKSLIRDATAYELGKSMGLQAPRYTFVEVYLNLDNQPLSADDYQGVYLLTEVLEVDKDRVNIKKLKKDDLTEPNITGGYLMQF